MPLVAAIDIGTNTSRLLIAETRGSGIVPVLVRREVTRLGGGFTENEGIAPDARERTLAALERFAAELSRYPVGAVRAAATSAVRDARNGAGFCSEALHRTGIALEVIGGDEEGLLTLKGALSGITPGTGDFMVLDIGGGSTEYVVAHETTPVFTRSLGLGVVRLTEGKGERGAMAEKIRSRLAVLQQEMTAAGIRPDPAGTTLVATAGTATTLAAIDLRMTDYDYRRVNNHILSVKKVEGILELLLPLSPADRLAVPGLEKGREDLIIAGTLILLESMKTFGFTEVKVSDFGLLEGLALSAAHRAAPLR